MPFAKRTLLAATLLAVRSFNLVAASDVATISEPPTATIAPRQVAGAPGTPILSTLHFAYTSLPEQVYPFAVLRGPQFGFNVCNSTTEGPTSDCQTLIFNGPDDFCLWGSPDANGEIGNVEAKVVAYCTKPGYGTRVIPPGSITGLQWIKTSAYIQVSGFINNPGIGLDPTDEGGELDPHGADLQGNPLGGVVFSNGTADSDGHTLTQVFNWNTFVGGGQFCFKACFNSITSPDYCENRYDLVGCDYNMPSNVQNGTFESCDGDLQTPVGTYTSNGQTLTWSMPDPLTTQPPYTPNIPASSNCQTFDSASLFAAAGTPSAAASGAGASGGASGASGAAKGSAAASAGSGSGSSGAAAASQTGKSGAGSVRLNVPVSLVASLVFVAFGAVRVLL